MRTIVIVWAMLTACLFVLGQFKVQPLAEASVVLPDDATYQPIVVQVEEHLKAFCPDDMVEIDGQFCPTVKQTCLQWRDAPNERCEHWSHDVQCTSAPIAMHYCVDRYEFPNMKGEVPRDWMSWYDAKNACENVGKRLCTRQEWTFAAEGPSRHPYPFGSGFDRDNTICNFDHKASEVGLTGDQIMHVSDPTSPVAVKLRSLLVPSGSMEYCKSDWGVFDMAGNTDEWTVNESGKPFKSSLQGGHVFGVRTASRPSTDAHGPWFRWYENSTRCCLK